ncbi:unnamed protein product [Allacma fusca]|uniref:Uncharacterized protein n=1 Tax=Allacma fusca TaxID=39272 RepID=A0A8J2JB34_9HEXA|nr:unnamed protein product [Allacma fusca]
MYGAQALRYCGITLIHADAVGSGSPCLHVWLKEPQSPSNDVHINYFTHQGSEDIPHKWAVLLLRDNGVTAFAITGFETFVCQDRIPSSNNSVTAGNSLGRSLLDNSDGKDNPSETVTDSGV